MINLFSIYVGDHVVVAVTVSNFRPMYKTKQILVNNKLITPLEDE